MIQDMRHGEGLGFSLPSWASNIVGAVLRGTQVTVPTPAGPLTFNLGNPADVAALKQLVTGTTVQVTRRPPPPSSPIEQAQAFVQEKVPGGWLTVAGVGLGAVLLFTMLRRR